MVAITFQSTFCMFIFGEIDIDFTFIQEDMTLISLAPSRQTPEVTAGGNWSSFTEYLHFAANEFGRLMGREVQQQAFPLLRQSQGWHWLS